MPSVIRHFLLATGLALLASPVSVWAACSSPAGDAGAVIFSTTTKTMQYCNGTNWVNTGKSEPAATQTGCTSPAGAAGAVIYAKPRGVVQFCNGQNWVDTSCAADRSPNGSGCGGKAAGTIQYSITANELQFCDSTNWVAMGWGCAGSSGSGGGGSCFGSTQTFTEIPSITGKDISQAFFSANGSHIYLPATDGTVFRSMDGGTTWTSLSAGHNFSALASSDDASILYGTDDSTQRVYKSTNQGTSWTLVSATLSADLVRTDSTGTKVWVGTEYATPNVLYYSANGGTTWTNITHPGMLYSFDINSDGSKINAVFGTELVASSTNNGANWNTLYNLSGGGGTQQFMTLRNDPSGNVISVLGLTYAPTIKVWSPYSTNGGSTWSNMESGGEPITVSVIAEGGQKMTGGFVETSGDNVMRSTAYTSDNGGTTWHAQPDLHKGNVLFTNKQGTKLILLGKEEAAPTDTKVYLATCP